MKRPLALALAITGLVGAALFAVGLAEDSHALRLAGKPWPVVALLVFTLATGSPVRGRLAVGLAFCLAGDVLLELGRFVLGVGAFLLGHVAYVAAFVGISRARCPLRLVPFVVYAAAMMVVLFPVLGPMRIPVAVYTLAITAMMWRASALVGEGDDATRRASALVVAGAVAFAVSDSLIALNRFHTPIPHVRWPIIGLYWIGQCGIALAGARLDVRK